VPESKHRYLLDSQIVPPTKASSIADVAPTDDHVVDYDRVHCVVYLRLLDAAKEGVAWEEVSKIVLGIDPDREPERAKRAYDTHLKRAKWMTTNGYKDLLQGSP
jgi:hypothetical protein